MITRFLLAIAFILNTNIYFSYGQTTKANEKEMQWFADAKLGVFIHLGIYSVNGIDESWPFFNDYISYDDYMKQLSGFTATKYRTDNWAKPIKENYGNCHSVERRT